MANSSLTLHDFYQLHKQLDPQDLILDVRNPDEFAQGHIEGALNLPLPELPHRSQELKPYRQIYIHCKRGGRARTARDLLVAQGFENLVCVEDAGMDAWIESGYPVKR